MGIDNSDGDRFKISTSALGTNDRLVIDAVGNVGIDTSYPGYKLHVNGPAYVADYIGVGVVPNSMMAGTFNAKASQTVGLYVKQGYSGISSKYGCYTWLDTAGTGIRYGFRTEVSANPADASGSYGSYQWMDHHNSSCSMYGNYVYHTGAGTGITYGYYAANESTNVLSGNLVVGTTTLSNYRLYVNGTTYCTAGAWAGSDKRWKKSITSLEDALGKVRQLQGVNYEWRTTEFPDKNFESGRQVGLIAQDVEKVVPELVKTDEQGYKAVAYDKITAVLVEAIKEQQQQIDDLKKTMAAKDSQLDQSRNELKKTQEQMVSLKERMDAIEVMMGKKNNKEVGLK
jgi:hypothetical protein